MTTAVKSAKFTTLRVSFQLRIVMQIVPVYLFGFSFRRNAIKLEEGLTFQDDDFFQRHQQAATTTALKEKKNNNH